MFEVFKIFVVLTFYKALAFAESYNAKSLNDEYLAFYRFLKENKDFNGLILKTSNSSKPLPNSILFIERNGNGFKVSKRTEQEKPEGLVHEISREYFKRLYEVLENALKTLNENENDESSKGSYTSLPQMAKAN